MILRAGRRDPIPGYEAPILRGVWERPTRMGAPRLWAALWLVGCLWVTLLLMTVTGFMLALIPVVVWALGQGMLVLLTIWDPFFDDLGVAHLVRRYAAFYEAG